MRRASRAVPAGTARDVAVPLPAGRVLQVMTLALGLGLLVNASSLDVKARAQPDGWRRTLAVAAMRPVAAVAQATRLDRPRPWFEQAVKSEPAGAPGRRRSTIAAAAAPPTTVAPPVVRLRVPTEADPLRLWVGGDSMAQVFGQSLVAMSVEHGAISATLEYRISTGLTRPDYFDWPAHLREDVLAADPEVVVIMFGANDAQSMEVAGKAEPVRSAAWQAEYRRRVAATMDLLAGDGRLIVWVGQPVMRDSDFAQREAILDGIYAEEAGRRPWIRFVDSRRLFAGPDGRYRAYLPDAEGDEVLMRQGDGIHLTRAGGDRLAGAVLDIVDAELAEAAAVAPTTPSTPAPPVAPPPTTTGPEPRPNRPCQPLNPRLPVPPLRPPFEAPGGQDPATCGGPRLPS